MSIYNKIRNKYVSVATEPRTCGLHKLDELPLHQVNQRWRGPPWFPWFLQGRTLPFRPVPNRISWHHRAWSDRYVSVLVIRTSMGLDRGHPLPQPLVSAWLETDESWANETRNAALEPSWKKCWNKYLFMYSLSLAFQAFNLSYTKKVAQRKSVPLQLEWLSLINPPLYSHHVHYSNIQAFFTLSFFRKFCRMHIKNHLIQKDWLSLGLLFQTFNTFLEDFSRWW